MRRSTCTRALSVCTVRHLTACALGPSIVSLNTKTPPPPPPHGMARHGPLALSALLGQRYEGPRANASQSQCEGPRANARHRLPTPRCAKIENTSSAIFRATVQPRSRSVGLGFGVCSLVVLFTRARARPTWSSRAAWAAIPRPTIFPKPKTPMNGPTCCLLNKKKSEKSVP